MDIATLADRLKINQRYLAAATGVLYWEAVSSASEKSRCRAGAILTRVSFHVQLATFPEEYRLIWRDRRWTPMKMAFLVK